MLLADKLDLDNDVTDPFQENMQEEWKTLAELEAWGAASELKVLRARGDVLKCQVDVVSILGGGKFRED